ncbi:flagellum site-determining protein YlxH [Oxobacter pfennigii]|uniref:Flagellum site-determining protein YlxH n=1 Tax=Oxobacter pfennigii TaxID=36849 RepID=A0A0P8YC57_9CLOT|nr:MinD/ParA family protein [Oxobacter pfennigii]KPU44706.1 flagellum site-determining protein YlxH [Oxobacter pfennigii]
MDQAQNLRRHVAEYRKRKKKNKRDIRVITVASGKGGVGKTNFSVNLAIALKEQGNDVVVLDADLGLANVDVIIGVIAKSNLYDVIFSNKGINDILINGPGGIKVVPGGSGIESLAELTESQRKILSDKFSDLKDTDILIVDTGAGISKNILGFIAVSDEVIVVTTPEPTAITDAYSLMKVTLSHLPKTRINLVVNRAMTPKQGEVTYQRLSRAVKNFLNKDVNYLGYVIDDLKVRAAVMDQIPFKVAYPSCDASKCLNTIAASLLGNEVETKSTGGGIKGFINKISYLFSKLD